MAMTRAPASLASRVSTAPRKPMPTIATVCPGWMSLRRKMLNAQPSGSPGKGCPSSCGGRRTSASARARHHRAVSAPGEMRAYDLSGYDGVLAFGETLSEVYRGWGWGWGDRVWTWHEAADIRRFRPPSEGLERQGLVWIGNWGDGERTEELQRFLLAPAQQARLPLDIYGVRYPREALALLGRHRAGY